MTQETSLSSVLNLSPDSPTWKIFSFERKDYLSLEQANRDLNSTINDIANRALTYLESKIPSINMHFPYLASNKSKLSLLFRMFSDLQKETSCFISKPKQYFENLERKPNIFNPIIVYEEVKQMLEWKRDKNFLIFCIDPTNYELRWDSRFRYYIRFQSSNLINEDPSERAKQARIWMSDKVNQTSLSQERKLYIRCKNLTELPSEIGQLTALEELWLSNNKLTFLPREIGRLTALEKLDIENNQLSSLPPEIGQLTALRVLYLNNNQFASLPPQIGHLTALTFLYLKDNQLTSLPPEIGQLTALKRLDLQHNKLTSLPKEIVQLTALKKLDLQHNKLTSLPKEIVQLTALKKLDLNKNPLIYLHRFIAQFDKNST